MASERCTSCGRPFRSKQPALVAEMSCAQTGNERCRIATAAFIRGAEWMRGIADAEAAFSRNGWGEIVGINWDRVDAELERRKS